MRHYNPAAPKLKLCIGPCCFGENPKGLHKRYTEFEPSTTTTDFLSAFCNNCNDFIVKNPGAAKLARDRYFKLKRESPEGKATPLKVSDPTPPNIHEKSDAELNDELEAEKQKAEIEAVKEKPKPELPEPEKDARTKVCKGKGCKGRGLQPLANFDKTHLSKDGYTTFCRQCLADRRVAKDGIKETVDLLKKQESLLAENKQLKIELETALNGDALSKPNPWKIVKSFAEDESLGVMSVKQVVKIIEAVLA